MAANIQESVIKIVAEQLDLNPSEVSLESSFRDDLGADSLGTVQLIMAFEDTFNIEIPDEDAEKITTVQEALDYIKNKIQVQA